MKRTLWILGLAICMMAVFTVTGCDQTESPVTPIDEVVVDQPGEDGTGVLFSLPQQWQYAVYREICFALSRDRYNANDWGASNRIIHNGGSWFAGDWSYRGWGRGIGGQCKDFASVVIDRATGGALDLPPGYNYATKHINTVRIGDVIQRTSPSKHTAIVLDILERWPNGNPKKLDVIDSNFIQSNTIARHVLPMWGYELNQFRVW